MRKAGRCKRKEGTGGGGNYIKSANHLGSRNLIICHESFSESLCSEIQLEPDPTKPDQKFSLGFSINWLLKGDIEISLHAKERKDLA